MKIAFCSSEVFPFAKTGGLADVSGSLPFALAKQGCEVKIFMPWYKNIKPEKTKGNYGLTILNKVKIYFVKNDDFFCRDGLYGDGNADYPDNLQRFSFFSEQIAVILKKERWKPDIIHANDWQTCPLIIFLKTKYIDDQFWAKTRCLLTIHNLAYQGIFPADQYPQLGLSWDYFNYHCLEYYGKLNLLKGGIVFADMVNTVSPTYAQQIQTEEYGCGLHGVLAEKKDRLVGILNAIDYKVWNPAKDKFIYANYSLKDLTNKAINKRKFQKEYGLKVDKKKLLLGMVSRLAEQKGVDILSAALKKILKKYQLAILGLGDKKYHQILEGIYKKNKENFALFLKFDEKIAHQIYAASDIFLMPSRFEPCGLSQMISYKYGTVPLVHKTGGLADTVIDYQESGGGFVFNQYSSQALVHTLERAEKVFKNNKTWQSLQQKIMRYNFSWDKAAKNYLNLYEKCRLLD